MILIRSMFTHSRFFGVLDVKYGFPSAHFHPKFYTLGEYGEKLMWTNFHKDHKIKVDEDNDDKTVAMKITKLCEYCACFFTDRTND